MLIEWEEAKWAEYWRAQHDFGEDMGAEEGGIEGVLLCVTRRDGEAWRQVLVNELAELQGL